MHISGLYVYPFKGAAPIRLTRAELDPFGIAHDRRWMAVDETGRFITAREQPALLQLDTHLSDGILVLRSASAGELRLPARPERQQGDTEVVVWLDKVTAMDQGEDAAAFITRHLGFGARIVFMPDATLRQADPAYARPGDRVSFADGFPLLLIGQSSLDMLNDRLGSPVPMERFRPNVVVSGAPAHAEDTWRRIRIGTLTCDVVKPCARCVVTTLDPATGAGAKEPLRTLAGYRDWDGKAWFGQNVIHRGTDQIALGAEVVVIEEGSARPPLAGGASA